jgi:hypothetical protein
MKRKRNRKMDRWEAAMSLQSEIKEAGFSYLTDRGITPETIQAHGIEIDPEPMPERFKQRLGIENWSGKPLVELVTYAIWFPCGDQKDNIGSWTVRLFPELDGAKFLTPKDARPFPFIPSDTWEVKDKANEPLIITEGPVKALAVLQAGGLPIGIGGVWMAVAKAANETQIELVAALKEFGWNERRVYLAFDADWSTNPGVKQALIRTYLHLFKQGAIVRCLKWPLSEGKGIDDYLVGQTKSGENANKALRRLLDNAVEISTFISQENLLTVQNELKSAGLSKTQLHQVCQGFAKKLNIRAGDLEKETAPDSSDENNNKTFSLNDPEPWPNPIGGATLLDELVSVIRRHVILSEAEAKAVGLWILLTFCEPYVDVLPILAITSPQKRCGKTTLLSIIARLVRKPLPASSISPAALYRSVEKWSPTLLIDEADAFLRDNDELRGILNAGHTRNSYIIRSNPVNFEPERFSTWSPKAIACIGKLPETLVDRSICIPLERRAYGDQIEKLRDADEATFQRLQSQACRWAQDNGEKVKQMRPKVPEVLNDRAADNWFPLLAIAAAAGGGWYEKAIKAALALSVDGSEANIAVILLSELKEIFTEKGEEFLSTEEILEGLNQNDEAPWADWKTKMTAKKFGEILKAHRVESVRPRKDGDRKRGYQRVDLNPVFNRYLPSPKIEPQSGPPTMNQVPELVGAGPDSKFNPGQGQMENSIRASAKADRQRIGGEWPGLDAKNGEPGDKPVSVRVNGQKFTLSEFRKLAFAQKIFNAMPCSYEDEDQD